MFHKKSPSPDPTTANKEEKTPSAARNSSDAPENPPPAGRHMRAGEQHRRSNSGASKLVSSVSMKVKKKLKHEDSIWKKTIILGEKCRVPEEEDEETILYDENGNRISAYHHRKTHSGALSFSRPAGLDYREDLSRK
ncbi:RNA-binding (RRM/RBD/RNP motifs) family protein [Striga asiatica]|uniref:RNA-binding (RRM/RBD/RNP motifs) family protein n=1 Tax=Striga asiatica TaxID=4170 RepID=A0A5A7PSY1_STRAF|nr:RNA-binding (RRM/RBD/RNP motifs) family protein [Striga asiatica]